MKLGAGAIFVAIGLLVLWFSITGRLSKFVDLWQQATDSGGALADPNAKPMSGPGIGNASPRQAALAAALNVPANFPALPNLN